MRLTRAPQTSKAKPTSIDVASADAGATYTAAERTLINELKTSLNDLKAKLRTAGVLS